MRPIFVLALSAAIAGCSARGDIGGGPKAQDAAASPADTHQSAVTSQPSVQRCAELEDRHAKARKRSQSAQTYLGIASGVLLGLGTSFVVGAASTTKTEAGNGGQVPTSHEQDYGAGAGLLTLGAAVGIMALAYPRAEPVPLECDEALFPPAETRAPAIVAIESEGKVARTVIRNNAGQALSVPTDRAWRGDAFGFDSGGRFRGALWTEVDASADVVVELPSLGGPPTLVVVSYAPATERPSEVKLTVGGATRTVTPESPHAEIVVGANGATLDLRPNPATPPRPPKTVNLLVRVVLDR
jgi:hypothetical protein